MRDELGRFVKGHPPTGGRKPRADEQAALALFKETATPERFTRVTEVLVERAEAGEEWAVKLFLAYWMGTPKQTIDAVVDQRFAMLARLQGDIDLVYGKEETDA
jgi:hypothetical protein